MECPLCFGDIDDYKYIRFGCCREGFCCRDCFKRLNKTKGCPFCRQPSLLFSPPEEKSLQYVLGRFADVEGVTVIRYDFARNLTEEEQRSLIWHLDWIPQILKMETGERTLHIWLEYKGSMHEYYSTIGMVIQNHINIIC